jgi:hypothetical protein
MGILGLGRIGKEVAIRAKVQKVVQSFNCSVQSFNCSVQSFNCGVQSFNCSVQSSNCSLSTAARQGIESAYRKRSERCSVYGGKRSCEMQL